MYTQCLEQVMSKHSLLFTKTSCHGNHTTSYIRTFHISTINSGINDLLYVHKHQHTSVYNSVITHITRRYGNIVYNSVPATLCNAMHMCQKEVGLAAYQ